MLPDLLNPRCLENFELKGPCPSPCISTRSEQFTRKFKYLNVLLLKKRYCSNCINSKTMFNE